MALANTAGAFLMLIFLNMYVYLATTRHTPFAHIKAMITGCQVAGVQSREGPDPAAPGMGNKRPGRPPARGRVGILLRHADLAAACRLHGLEDE